MAYCILDDILGVIPELELIQLTDDLVPPAVVNTDVVDVCISQADSIINGYIGGRYALPLATLPELLKAIALDITVYRVYLRRKKKTPPEAVKTAYEDAMKQLKDIQSGKLSLGVDQAGTEVKPSAGLATFTSAGRVCTRDTMKGL